MIKVFKSEFLNTIVNQEFYSRKIETKNFPYKHLVKDNIDKYVWNCLVSDDKFIDITEIPITLDSLMSKYCRSYGSSSTYFGEWIRAFNKILYRRQNDGDAIYWGPYSAINYYLNSSLGDRQFRFDGEFGYIYFEYEFKDENGQENGRIGDNINRLIYQILGESVTPDWPMRNYNCKKWADSFCLILDSLIDDIKGVKEKLSEWDSCDKYYKNCMEYKDKKLYDFFSENFNMTKWTEDGFDRERSDNDRFFNDNEIITIERNSYNDYICNYNFYGVSAIDLNGSFTFTIDKVSDKLKRIIDIYQQFKDNKESLCKVLSLEDLFNYRNIERPIEISIRDSNNTDTVVYNGNKEDLLDKNLLKNSFVISGNEKSSDNIFHIVIELKKDTKHSAHYYNKGKEVWCNDGILDAICVTASSEETAIKCCEINNNLEELFPDEVN